RQPVGPLPCGAARQVGHRAGTIMSQNSRRVDDMTDTESVVALTLTTLLAGGADDATALSTPGGVPLTYERLRALVADTARVLGRAGIGAGDRVAIVLDNGPEMAAAFLSIAACA